MERAKTTIIEMMNDRDYIPLSCDISDNEFLFRKEDDEEVIVFLSSLPKFNIDTIKEYIHISKTRDIRHIIIVYNDNITSQAKKVIENVHNMVIETFPINILQFNITQHRYYNPHSLLTPSQRDKFIKNYGTKIPIIYKTDPVSRYFNFKRGDIIKILRKGGFVSYRMVK